MNRCRIPPIFMLLFTFLFGQDVHKVELAGKPLDNYPYFQFAQTINENSSLFVGIDPNRFPFLVNQTVEIFIVQSKNQLEWSNDPALLDVSPEGSQINTVAGSLIRENIFLLTEQGELISQDGIGIGAAYDIVIDVDQNGELSDGDLIDGFSDKPGVYIVHDTSVPGPLEVEMIQYSGGDWLDQRTFFPSNIADFGELPLIIISHGWSLTYTDYDYLANHLASYGYVVMAHSNNTGNGWDTGTESAAITILQNIDYILGNLSTIGDGILNGHIDNGNLVLTGHSTGGEAVVRAYTRLRMGNYLVQNFNDDDIALIVSIAPVSFWSADFVHPYNVNYHMFVGAADTDCSGAPIDNYVQSMAIFERSYGNRHLTYIQGAGHDDFDNSQWDDMTTGPDQIGKITTQAIVKGYFLPLIEFYTKNNPAALDFLTRMYDDFHPIGIPEYVIIANEFRQAENSGNFVIDDYETSSNINLSSSGASVNFTVSHVQEVLMQDINNSFTYSINQPSNGMTRARFNDSPHCVVFDWTSGENVYYEYLLIESQQDVSPYGYLSFRACQGTRHPETDALNEPLDFTITLIDHSENSSSINFGEYGKLTRPYLRTGYGAGAGWGNEFSTVRIRLIDFTINGTGVDLSHIDKIRFDFGSDFGAERGRIGLDNVELTDFHPIVPEIQLGDLNQDGAINVVDVILTVNIILTEGYDPIADLNHDGEINVVDIIMIINIILS